MKIGNVLYLEGKVAYSNEVQQVLEELSFAIFMANTIGQAELIMNTKSIDLIILNVRQNDGIDSIAYATSLKGEAIPIVFLAYDNNKAVYEKVKQANLVAYLVSPVDMLTLTSIVESTLALVK